MDGSLVEIHDVLYDGQAKARTDRSDQRGNRIAQCDGGQSCITEALPDKEPIDNGVNPRQCECEDGRNDIGKEFLVQCGVHLPVSPFLVQKQD